MKHIYFISAPDRLRLIPKQVKKRTNLDQLLITCDRTYVFNLQEKYFFRFRRRWVIQITRFRQGMLHSRREVNNVTTVQRFTPGTERTRQADDRLPHPQLTTQTRLRYSSTMISSDFLAAISLSSLSIVNTKFWIVLLSCRSFVQRRHQRCSTHVRERDQLLSLSIEYHNALFVCL